MNNPNPSPLIPQGSIPPVRGKSNVRIAVFTIIAIHAVLCFGLLMQGCKRDGDKATNKTTDNIAVLPPIDTNYYNATDAVSTLSPSATPAPTQPASSNPAPAGNPSPVTQPGQVNPAPAQPAALPPVEPPTTPVPADAKEYTVVRGDSFYKIGKAHGVSISAIAKANPNVDPVKLKPGQKLMIPAPTPSAASTSVANVTSTAAPENGAAVHVVKPGENLTRIARQHGTTIKALKAANNLKTDRVNAGQKLKVPSAGNSAAAGLDPVPPSPLEAGPNVTPLPTVATGASAQ